MMLGVSAWVARPATGRAGTGHLEDLVEADQVLVANLVAKKAVPGRSLRIP
jgi:hypothetical protein